MRARGGRPFGAALPVACAVAGVAWLVALAAGPKGGGPAFVAVLATLAAGAMYAGRGR